MPDIVQYLPLLVLAIVLFIWLWGQCFSASARMEKSEEVLGTKLNGLSLGLQQKQADRILSHAASLILQECGDVLEAQNRSRQEILNLINGPLDKGKNSRIKDFVSDLKGRDNNLSDRLYDFSHKCRAAKDIKGILVKAHWWEYVEESYIYRDTPAT